MPTPRILVVEDDEEIRGFCMAVLTRSGYEVDAAGDGADAWKALNADIYDLLLTDNNLPEVSGVELLKRLRAARMVLPVIMASGSLPEEEFIRHPWLQPDATMLKPYGAKELLATVKHVLQKTESQREHIYPDPWMRQPCRVSPVGMRPG